MIYLLKNWQSFLFDFSNCKIIKFTHSCMWLHISCHGTFREIWILANHSFITHPFLPYQLHNINGNNQNNTTHTAAIWEDGKVAMGVRNTPVLTVHSCFWWHWNKINLNLQNRIILYIQYSIYWSKLTLWQYTDITWVSLIYHTFPSRAVGTLTCALTHDCEQWSFVFPI